MLLLLRTLFARAVKTSAWRAPRRGRTIAAPDSPDEFTALNNLGNELGWRVQDEPMELVEDAADQFTQHHNSPTVL